MSERAFFLKLSAIIAIKFVLLMVLWFFFVRDYHIHLDAMSVANHLQH